MSEVLACPFCGKSPKTARGRPKLNNGLYWAWVRCENKRCEAYDLAQSRGVFVVGAGINQTEARYDAIHRWNKRAPV